MRNYLYHLSIISLKDCHLFPSKYYDFFQSLFHPLLFNTDVSFGSLHTSTGESAYMFLYCFMKRMSVGKSRRYGNWCSITNSNCYLQCYLGNGWILWYKHVWNYRRTRIRALPTMFYISSTESGNMLKLWRKCFSMRKVSSD